MPKIKTENFYPIIIDENIVNTLKDNITRQYLYIKKDYKIGLSETTYFYNVGTVSKMFSSSIEREINGLSVSVDKLSNETLISSRPIHKMLNLDLVDGIDISNDDIYKIIELYDTDIVSASSYINQSTNDISHRFFNISEPTLPCEITKNKIDQSIFGEISYKTLDLVTELLIENNYTPTYFYYNIKNRHVIAYDHSFTKLLAIRSNKNGQYVLFRTVDDLVNQLPFLSGIENLYKLIPSPYTYNIEYVEDLCRTQKDIKGYLIILNNGDLLYKLSLDYVNKAKIYNSTPKGLFKAILNNVVEVNEIEAIYNNNSDTLELIYKIESSIIEFIEYIEKQVFLLFNNYGTEITNKSEFLSYVNNKIMNFNKVEKTLILHVVTTLLDDPYTNIFAEVFEILKNNINPYWKYIFKSKIQ